MIYWSLRAKIKKTIDGDGNSRFFHASASHRRRHNKIHSISLHNQDFTAHEVKCQILTSYYTSILGTPFSPTWNFSLQSLYPHDTPQLLQPDSPFSVQEIYDAFTDMNTLASPGLDGFGPGFFFESTGLF